MKIAPIYGTNATVIGVPLEAALEVSPTLTVARERCLNCFKDYHSHPRTIIIFPRGASRFEIGFPNGTPPLQIDQRSFAMVPANLSHYDKGLTHIYDAYALLPSDELMNEIFNDLKINKFAQDLKPIVSKKSVWLDETVEKINDSRFFNKNLPDKWVTDLEIAALREVLHLIYSESTHHKAEDGSNEIISFLEANLFEPFSLSMVAKKFHLSVSAFSRNFQEKFSCSPAYYVRTRRFEEARGLLESGHYSVDDVANILNFSDASSFSHAFKRHFKISPAECIHKSLK